MIPFPIIIFLSTKSHIQGTGKVCNEKITRNLNRNENFDACIRDECNNSNIYLNRPNISINQLRLLFKNLSRKKAQLKKNFCKIKTEWTSLFTECKSDVKKQRKQTNDCLLKRKSFNKRCMKNVLTNPAAR